MFEVERNSILAANDDELLQHSLKLSSELHPGSADHSKDPENARGFDATVRWEANAGGTRTTRSSRAVRVAFRSGIRIHASKCPREPSASRARGRREPRAAPRARSPAPAASRECSELHATRCSLEWNRRPANRIAGARRNRQRPGRSFLTVGESHQPPPWIQLQLRAPWCALESRRDGERFERVLVQSLEGLEGAAPSLKVGATEQPGDESDTVTIVVGSIQRLLTPGRSDRSADSPANSAAPQWGGTYPGIHARFA